MSKKNVNDILSQYGRVGTDPYDREKNMIVFENWRELWQATVKLNEELAPVQWEQWESVYNACMILEGESYLYDLRLGTFRPDEHYNDQWRLEQQWSKLNAWKLLKSVGRADPHMSEPYYRVPDGLHEIEDFMNHGFSDEYQFCEECDNIVRTSPDSYSWKMGGGYIGDSLLCEDCLPEHTDEYLEEKINNPRSTVAVELLNLDDWEEIDINYKTGFHSGQNDDPKRVSERLLDYDIDHFFVHQSSQFTTTWQVWTREEDSQLAKILLDNFNVSLPYDIAAEMSKALKGQHSDHVRVDRYVVRNGKLTLED